MKIKVEKLKGKKTKGGVKVNFIGETNMRFTVMLNPEELKELKKQL